MKKVKKKVAPLMAHETLTAPPAFHSGAGPGSSLSVRPSWPRRVPSMTQPEFEFGSSWSEPPTMPHGERIPALPGAHHGAWPQLSCTVGFCAAPRYL